MIKRHTINKIILIPIIVLLSICLAESQNIVVKQIPQLDKLPVNALHRIFQDSDGFMWYGTFNGLCRSDGYNVRTFRSDLNHKGLLTDNYITYINEDKNKNIWFGTLKGAYILDKETYKIRHLDMDKFTYQNIYSINVTNDGYIWISIPGTLLKYNSSGKKIKQYNIKNSGCVYTVYQNPDNELIISVTLQGMYKLDAVKDRFIHYYFNPKYKDIEKIIWDNEHKCYWLGTWGNGILQFTPHINDNDKIYVEQPLPISISGIPVKNTYHMVQDDKFNYLWVTSWNDLYVFKVNEKRTLEQVNTSPFITQGNKLLYEIYKDRDNKLWVSSFDIESFVIDIKDNIIKSYKLTKLKETTQSTPAISSLFKDDNDIFWFRQERFGIFLYDKQKDKLTSISESKDYIKYKLNDINNFYKSKNKNFIWATHKYSPIILRLSENNMKVKVTQCINLDKKIPEGTYITYIIEEENKLWIATDNGLYIYNISGGTVNRVSNIKGNISAMTKSSDNSLWLIMNDNTLCSINNGDKIKRYKFTRKLECMSTSSNGNLWIGTNEGEIIQFNSRDKQKFHNYSKICGMNGDIINNIVVDNYNHVWIVTNHNIKEFNPHNNAYKNYSSHDNSSQIKRFLENSICYNENIYFGGIGGIVSISPTQQLESIPQQKETHITDIKVMGESIYDDNRYIKDGMIEIYPEDQNLEIEFSSLDFLNIDQIRYAYRLDGVDKQWIYLDHNKNSAFYNKLHKGEYCFEVKSTDCNGLWSDKVTKLTIIRLPAWYESWLAYTIYFILIISITAYSLYVYVKKIERRNKEIALDSKEMIRMSDYLSSNDKAEEPEFVKLDMILIDKITKTVEVNLAKTDFDVNELAYNMNMSRSTLTRKIKIITNKTPLEFIKDIKMKNAALMLKSRTATISEIIAAIGYNDYKNFIKTFKNKYGITPSEYQKRQKDYPNDDI